MYSRRPIVVSVHDKRNIVTRTGTHMHTHYKFHVLRTEFLFADESQTSWYSTNCGHKKGFVCKKSPGSDSPIPILPTEEVPGYCPQGYFGVGKRVFTLHNYLMRITGNPSRNPSLPDGIHVSLFHHLYRQQVFQDG